MITLPTTTPLPAPTHCPNCGRPFVYKPSGKVKDDGRTVVMLCEVHLCVR